MRIIQIFIKCPRTTWYVFHDFYSCVDILNILRIEHDNRKCYKSSAIDIFAAAKRFLRILINNILFIDYYKNNYYYDALTIACVNHNFRNDKIEQCCINHIFVR